MARLPTPGQDNGTWGEILNQFLTVEHNPDGSLKISGTLASKADDATVVHISDDEVISGIKTFSSSPIVPTPSTSTAAANKSYVDTTVLAGAPDATLSNKGILQLAGDLGGTATNPTVPALTTKAGKSSTETITGTWDFQTEPTLLGTPITSAFMPSLQQYGPSRMVSPIPILCFRDVGVLVANRATFARVVVPESGILAHLGINVVTASGNIDVGIYSIGSTCERLYSTGTIACPAAGWRVVGDPQLAVEADDMLLFMLVCDNTTASFSRLPHGGSSAAFPTTWSAEIGGLWAGVVNSVMPLPQTIPVANLVNNPSIPAVAAKLVAG